MTLLNIAVERLIKYIIEAHELWVQATARISP